MTMLLEGRTALVTGGTSGIGRGIAEAFARHGARVAVTGLTAEECEAARVEGFLAYELDARDRAACERTVAQALADLGGLSVLAANAGIYPQTRLAELGEEEIDRIFAVNVKGTIHTTSL